MVDSGAVRLAFEEGLGMGKNRQKKRLVLPGEERGGLGKKLQGLGTSVKAVPVR